MTNFKQISYKKQSCQLNIELKVFIVTKTSMLDSVYSYKERTILLTVDSPQSWHLHSFLFFGMDFNCYKISAPHDVALASDATYFNGDQLHPARLDDPFGVFVSDVWSCNLDNSAIDFGESFDFNLMDFHLNDSTLESDSMKSPPSMIHGVESFSTFGFLRNGHGQSHVVSRPFNQVCNSLKASNWLSITRRNNNEKMHKKANVIKGQWTHEEDKLLVKLVEQYGLKKWSQIAELIKGRIGKQCRDRWHNHLRPNIKKETWSDEEDRILILAHSEIGNKWSEIARKLPGRTENSIKNHWNATKRRLFARRCHRRSKKTKSGVGSILEDYIRKTSHLNQLPASISSNKKKSDTSVVAKEEAASSWGAYVDEMMMLVVKNENIDMMTDICEYDVSYMFDGSSNDAEVRGNSNNNNININATILDERDFMMTK